MHRAEELADELGISIRTFYRRVKSGEIEAVDTIAGRRYALADDARPAPDESAIRRAPVAHVATEREQELEERVEALEAELARLQTKLQDVVDWTGVASRCLHDLAKRR